jgi:peptide/nickel transport system substrate-binding protein
MKQWSLWVGLMAASTLIPAALAQSATPVRGGTVVDSLYEEPDSILPNAGAPMVFAEMVQNTLFTPLLYTGPHGNLRPGLASEVPSLQNGGISKNGLTYTFHLRPGLKWSDGKPLTSADIAFTANLWKNPQYAGTSKIGYPDIASVSTPNSTTVVFHLKKVFPPFLYAWANYYMPVPKHILDHTPPSQIGVGKFLHNPGAYSGPFMLKQWVVGDHITVVRNPYYYRKGYPYLNSIIFKIVPDQNTQLLALKAGEADIGYFLPITQYSLLKSMRGFKLTLGTVPPGWESIWLNEQDPALKSTKVRLALTYGLNREQMIKDVWHNLALPIANAQPPGDVSYDPSIKPLPYDPAKAAQLLKEAGWVKGSNGMLEKNGKPFVIVYSTTSGNPWRSQDEQIVQSDWGKLGIQVKIVNYPASTFFGTIVPKGKADAMEFEELNLPSPGLYLPNFYESNKIPPNGQNYEHYNNPKVDALIHQMNVTVNPKQLMHIYHEIGRITAAQVPMIYLYAPPNLAVNSTRLHNYNQNNFAYDTWNSWEWWVSK